MEVKEFDQYVVRIHGSGRLTTRNRRFLKKILPYALDVPQIKPSRIVANDHNTLPLEEADNDQQQRDQVMTPTFDSGDCAEDPVSLQSENGLQDVQVQQEEVESGPRRSTRIRNVPDRLNIETTKGQSYMCCSRNSSHSSYMCCSRISSQSVSQLLPSKNA